MITRCCHVSAAWGWVVVWCLISIACCGGCMCGCGDVQIIYSKNDLTDEHIQYFVYQILRGLKFIHTAHVCTILHRTALHLQCSGASFLILY